MSLPSVWCTEKDCLEIGDTGVVENSPTLTFIEHDSVALVNYLSRFTSVIHEKPISEPGSIEVCPFLTSWEE